jgi:colanic acid/amylovoran biosynthesis glycosyltransferase
MESPDRKLRIAFILRFFPSLSETFILTQLVNLLKRGHEIYIVALPTEKQSVVHPDVDHWRLMERTHYAPPIPGTRWRRRFKTAGWIFCLFWLHPIDLPRLLWVHLRNPGGFDYESLYYGFCFLGRRDDIVHAHFGYSGRAAAFLGKAGMARRIITTFHGSDVNRYPRIHGRAVYDALFQAGDLFTVNTDFTGGKLRQLGCDPEKIRVLPVGLEIHSFSFKERIFPQDGRLCILTVGRLVEKKGHRYMIRALPEIVKRYPHVQYLIVGDGELDSCLRSLAEEMNLEGHVRFLGSLPAEQVRTVYDQAHLFVLPSVTAADGDMEGQGLVLQEAQACGLPVVSTYHNGIPDGILEGQSGFLVPEQDSEALTRALLSLIEHPELWAAMGRCGRDYVARKYDIDRLNGQIEDWYYYLVKSK